MFNHADESTKNQFGDGALRALLRNATILDLSYAELRDADIVTLAKALTERAEGLNIMAINLLGNCFSGHATAVLMETVSLNCPNIRELKLDERSVCGAEAIGALNELQALKPLLRIKRGDVENVISNEIICDHAPSKNSKMFVNRVTKSDRLAETSL